VEPRPRHDRLGHPGGGSSSASSINERGQAAGLAETAPSEPQHGFLWDPKSGFTDLGPFAVPVDLNDRGQVLGTLTLTPEGESLDHAFVWDRTSGMTDLGTLGGSRTRGSDINNDGQVTGQSHVTSDTAHAFLWSSTTGMMDLGTLGGQFSFGSAINDRGEIVGVSQNSSGENHPFVWSSRSGLTDLETGDGPIHALGAWAINSRGQVTGDASDNHGFVWDRKSGITYLESVAEGLILPASSRGVEINERGQILAEVVHGDGERQHYFLWVPN